MRLSHAMHTTGTFGQGQGKIRKKAVFWELKPLETNCSDSLWCLQFFLSSPIRGGKMGSTQTCYFLLRYHSGHYNAVTMKLSMKASQASHIMRWMWCRGLVLYRRTHDSDWRVRVVCLRVPQRHQTTSEFGIPYIFFCYWNCYVKSQFIRWIIA